MGRKSTRTEKNIYQTSREAAGLTRETAGELMVYISPERIEKIESGKTAAHPDEVMAMEAGYKNPELSNYYCTHECPIGKKYVPEAKLREFSHVTVELLDALNDMQKEKDRLIAIAVDNRVNDFERRDFDTILNKLDRIDRSIQSMRIWIEHAKNTGKMDDAE